MSLYPSLEDMKVDSMLAAQQNVSGNSENMCIPSYDDITRTSGLESGFFCYNESGELVPRTTSNLSSDHPPPYPTSLSNSTIPRSGSVTISTTDRIGVGDIKHGIRPVTVYKNEKNKVGVQLRSIEKGIFVSFVEENSPAAMAGLRFGDQVLEINGVLVAGFTGSKAMDLLKQSARDNIKLSVRDCPLARVVTVHKNSHGTLGFEHKNGLVTAIVKDSSCARNGLLINHQIIEVNGHNVMGLSDKQFRSLINHYDGPVKLSFMPKSTYDQLIKNLTWSQIKHEIDRSTPLA